ncbi:MAG: lipoate--protein ligase [Eubacteriales bacterium]|nr:lipoate--protein ligase [Eubacteriales bacterium]
MLERLRLYIGKGTDPYRNLAVEQHLMETVPEDMCILYLWQNADTVVIGRNQNAWKECRTALLEQEGGRLARRLSGGGAVFHDLGNLNFTFLVPTAHYDLDRQLAVVQGACRSLGVRAERSGRNDILAEGRKFSGNAFYKNAGRSYHHGTLLVDADMERMTRYLAPSRAKLTAKGVDSVRSRVVNLREIAPDISIEALKQALAEAFAREYALPCEAISERELDRDAIEKLRQRNAGWEWNYGLRAEADITFEERFLWGSIQFALSLEGGIVKEARIYTDAMDWSLAPRLEAALCGCRFSLPELSLRLAAAELAPEQQAELLALLKKAML